VYTVQAAHCKGTEYSRLLSFGNWQLLRNVANIVTDSESSAFLTPSSGMGKNLGPGSGSATLFAIFLRIEYTFFGLKILKFLDPDPGSRQPWIRDLGWKNGSGIRDKHPVRNTGCKNA
jgi:hypothetical protein